MLQSATHRAASTALFMPPLPAPGRHELWLKPLAGAFGGTLTGLTGIAVIPTFALYQAMGFPRDFFIQALGVWFLSSFGFLGLALGRHEALSGELLLASSMALVPALAGQWIGRSLAGWDNGTLAIFAIALKDTEQLIGCIGLHNIKQHSAQLGFWLGVPFWGQGYCTEAARRLVDFGFFDLKLSRIFGQHRRLDPKPGKVLERAGLSFVRVKPDATRVNRITEDLSYYEATHPSLIEI